MKETLANGFWQSLLESERSALRAAGRPRDFDKGGSLCNQGGVADHILIILDGWVKVTAYRADGHEVLLAIRSRHDTIGESGWLYGRSRSANVFALSRVHALAVPAEQFATIIGGHPHAAQELAKAMVGRLDDADRRMTDQVGAGGDRRLARLLVDLADRYGVPQPDGSIGLGLPLTQLELATMIGMARETVARAYTRWRDAGIITTGRKRIDIHDLPALQAIADGPDA